VVKELRLASISRITEANRFFLKALPKIKGKSSVTPPMVEHEGLQKPGIPSLRPFFKALP
jgi:hypothetical protein